MRQERDILIVEDEPVVIEAAKKILLPEGFRVVEATDVASAWHEMRVGSFRVILTDLMLPNVNGFELIEKVKQNHPDIPIIAVTGFATFETAVKSLKLGAFDFIPKPFALEELLSVVSRAMRFGKMTKRPISAGNFLEQLHKQRLVGGKLVKYYFLGQHAWAQLDQDGSAMLGVAETFPRIIGEIQRIDFPPINEEISQGNVCVQISTKQHLVHTVWAPLSGRVIEYNHEIERNANLINSDPFFQGWLVRIIPTNLEPELANLVLR